MFPYYEYANGIAYVRQQVLPAYLEKGVNASFLNLEYDELLSFHRYQDFAHKQDK
jgi:hypothetical protein